MSAFKSISKPSFRSYLDNNGDSRPTGGTSNISRSSRNRGSQFFVDQDTEKVSMEVNLLPGEIVISKVPEVHRFVAYTEGSRGHTGTFYVTNFKVSFVTVELHESSNQNSASKALTRVNKLIGANDIALTSICDLYQILKGKRKRLVPGVMLPTFVQQLEICCKNFQTHNFAFNGDRESSKCAVNSILHHAFPARLDLFFVFSFKLPILSTSSISQEDIGVESHVKDYLSASDWQSELERLNAAGFRVTSSNLNFELSSSLPEHFVIPETLSDSVVKEQKCFPVWCYTHRSGSSLVRMSRCANIVEYAHEIMSHIKKSHPKNRKADLINLNDPEYNLPTLKELQTSIEKLREACMPSTTKDLTSGDNGWLTSVEESCWLNHVSSVLCLVSLIIDKIAFINRSVLLIEDGQGRDWSPVMSSLTQICLDSWCRTMKGFEELVEREWICLGHPFRDRTFYNKLSKDQQSPVFALFLDCVWQLVQQFPSSFQFNTIFLTTLHDSVNLGVFRNFVFNCTKERVDRTLRESRDKVKPTVRQSSISCTLPLSDSPSVYKVLPASRTPISKTLPANQSPQYKVLPSLRAGAPPSQRPSTNQMEEKYRDLPTYYSEISVGGLEPANYDDEICKVLNQSSSSSDTPSVGNQSPISIRSAPFSSPNHNTSRNLTSVWDWLVQFNPPGVDSFVNSLYKAADASRRLRAVDDKYNSRCVTAAQTAASLHTGKVERDTGRILRLVEDALKPCASVACLRVWEHCYLRWLSPILLMNGGGEPAELLAQQRLLREIELLQGEVNRYENDLVNSGSRKTSKSADRSPESPYDNVSMRERKRLEFYNTVYPVDEMTSRGDLSEQHNTCSLNSTETGSDLSQAFSESLIANQVRSLESIVSSSYPYSLQHSTNTVPFIANSGSSLVDSTLAGFDDSTSIYDVDVE